MDGIWDLIESVSEGFPTYSSIHMYCGRILIYFRFDGISRSIKRVSLTYSTDT